MSQFTIIGIGNFGYYLATSLYEKGHEVMAIDKSDEIIQDIKDSVTHAVVADSTNQKALEALGIEGSDAVVVCIGSILSNSVLTALNLKEIGVNKIYAKALSSAHARVLEKMGVTEVLFPEKDIGVSLAERLHNPNIIDYLSFMEGYSISEIEVPKKFINLSLRDVDMINRYGVQVVGVKVASTKKINFIPTGNYLFKEGDKMIILGTKKGFKKLQKND